MIAVAVPAPPPFSRIHRQRRRRMLGVYEENVLGVYEENVLGVYEENVLGVYEENVLGVYEDHVCCLTILLWAVRRYTGITLGFRSQGVGRFV